MNGQPNITDFARATMPQEESLLLQLPGVGPVGVRALGSGVLGSPLMASTLNRLLIQGFSYALAMALTQAACRLEYLLKLNHTLRRFAEMKKVAVCMMLLFGLVLTTTAFAQDQEQGTGQNQGRWERGQGRHGGRMMMDPDARLQRMSKQLNLTEEQKAKIKPILENETKQIDTLRQDTSTAQQDRRAKFQEIHQSTMSEIRPILNADQQKKLDNMIKQQQERRSRGGWGQGGGTPQ